MHLFVSGSGFSGSGFLLDFLREQSTVSVLPFRPFNYKSAGMKIGHQVLDLFLEQNLHTSRLLAFDIVSQLEVSKLRCDEQSKSAQSAASQRIVGTLWRAKRGISSAFRITSPNPEIKSGSQPLVEAERDLAVFRALVSPPPGGDISKEEMMKTWFAEKIRRNLPPKASNLVAVDKTVPKERDRINALLEIANPARVIFVVRDPYDQVEDAFRSKKRNRARKKSFEENLANYLQSKVLFTETMIDFAIKRPHQVAIVRFESLVQDHLRSMQRLSEWLGVELHTSEYSHLDLEVSASNIGILGDLVERNKSSFRAFVESVAEAERAALV